MLRTLSDLPGDIKVNITKRFIQSFDELGNIHLLTENIPNIHCHVWNILTANAIFKWT